MYYVMKMLVRQSEPSVLEAGDKKKCVSFFDGYKSASIHSLRFLPKFRSSVELPEYVNIEYAHVRLECTVRPEDSFDLYIAYYDHAGKGNK